MTTMGSFGKARPQIRVTVTPTGSMVHINATEWTYSGRVPRNICSRWVEMPPDWEGQTAEELVERTWAILNAASIEDSA